MVAFNLHSCQTALGSECRVMCELGFHRHGSGLFMCGDDGEWSGSLLCVPAEPEPEAEPAPVGPAVVEGCQNL